MADQDMDLVLRVTGDASSGVSAINQTSAAMDRLPETVNISQQSLDRLSAALDSIVKQYGLVADSSEKAAGGIKKVSSATSEATKIGSEFNSVGGDFARVASAIGVQSGEAAGRIGALVGALDSLKAAAPAITGVIAGAVAGISGFEFIKDAISSASDLQNSMTRLGQVVKDQGGNWNLLSRQVQDFTDAQIRSTTYSDTQVVNSLERLVASGMSVKDAMVSTRVAEDLAAGSGRSLEESTNSLIEATHGRLMGLEAEGILTKEQIKTGLTYDQVLQQIESHMGGAATAATTTYSGALANLGAVWQKLLEDAGTPFLGLLTSIVHEAAGVVESIDTKLQPSFKSISDWATSQIPVVMDWFNQLKDTIAYLGHEFRDVAGSDGAGALEGALTELHRDLDSVEASLDHGKSGWEFTRDLIKQVADTASTLADILGKVQGGLNSVVDAQNRFASSMHQFWNSPEGKVSAWLAGTPLGAIGIGFGITQATLASSGSVGGGDETSGVAPRYYGSGGIKTAPANLPPPPPPPGVTTNYDPFIGGGIGRGGSSGRGGHTAAPSPFNSGTDVTPDYHFDQQSSAVQKLNDELAQLPKTVDGYTQAMNLLAPVIAQDTQKQQELGSELDNARNRLSVATTDLNNFKEATNGVSQATANQIAKSAGYSSAKAELAALTQAQRDAQHQVDTLSSAYTKNASELDGLTKKQREAQDSIQRIKDAWAQYISDADAKSDEELATFKLTNAEKVPYYQDVVNRLLAENQQYTDKFKQAYQSLKQAEVQAYEDGYRAEQQFVSSATSKMSSFLDTIIVEHKSMASALKSVYQDIEKWFIDMLAQMIAKALVAMPIFQSILSMFGLGGGGGVAPGVFGSTGVVPGFGGVPGMGGNAQQSPPTMGGNLGGGGTAPIMSSPAIAAAMSYAMLPSGGGGSVGSGSYDTGGGMLPDTGGSNPFGGGSIPFGGGLGSTTASGGASGGTQTSSGFNFGAGFGGGAPGIIAGLLGRSGIGGLGMAAFGGSMIGDIAFGGKGYSALGGTFGALAAMGAEFAVASSAFAAAGLGGLGLAPFLGALGPAGWAVILGGALLGAFGGSLFGDHFNIADEPDIGQTNAWGQANADMQGMTSGNPMNANGKQFVMDSQTSQATGGKGWNLLFEKFVQQYRGNIGSLPYTLQSAFPEIEQLWGGATDKQYFNPDGKDGYLDIGSGKRALWTEFWGAVQNYGSDISQLMQSNSPISMYVTSVNGAMRSIGSGTQTPGGDNPFIVGGRHGGGGGGDAGSNAIASGGPGALGGSIAEQLRRSLSISLNVRNSATLIDSNNVARSLQTLVVEPLASALEHLNVR